MANLNRVFLIGHLTRDPEVRYTPQGTPVCELGLAINRTWSEDGQKREEDDFRRGDSLGTDGGDRATIPAQRFSGVHRRPAPIG